MLARALTLSSLFLAAACGHHAAPAANTPAGGTSPSVSASTTLALDGAPWTIAVAGTAAADGE